MQLKKHLFISYLLFVYTLNSYTQSKKTIDSFQFDTFYTQIIDGEGYASDSIIKDTINNKSQNILKLKYFLSGGRKSKFSSICNYNKATQDYSFMPASFSFLYRGGNNTDIVYFRLWEDINRNGIFDEDDELYKSTYFKGGSKRWKKQIIPINSFKKEIGKGNNKLDLNRIRAWEFVIENTNNHISKSSLDITNLQLTTNYKPKTYNNTKFTGTFITLTMSDKDQNGYWNKDRWVEEIKKMQKININKIIIQYGVYQNIAWYNTSKLKQVSISSMALNNLFEAVNETNIQIILGLSFSESWNKSNKSDTSLYSNLFDIQKQTIDELYSQFGTNSNFAGWYIPQEINDLDWQNDPNKSLLFKWLQQTSAYAHSKDKNKEIIIAPFFNLWQPADIIGNWYNELLKATPDITCIYPQDGVGTTRKEPDVDIPLYFNKIKQACDNNNRKFGAVIEAFEQTAGWPINLDKFKAIPASSERIKRQIQEAYQFKPNEIIIFEWRYITADTFNYK